MPFFENARNVTITGTTIINDIAGNYYSFRPQTAPLDHLNELSAPAAIYDLGSGIYPGTDVTLLKPLENWIAEKNVPILLLSGPAGIGKSTIARTFASNYVHVTHSPVISFRFAHDSQCSDLSRVPPTLATQLRKINQPRLKETIESTLEADPLIWSRSLSKQFIEFVIKPIGASLATTPHTKKTFLIFLDDLDACQDHDILGRFMSDIKTVIANESHYSRIKILCTSRDVPSINMAFSPLIKYYRRLLIPPQVPKSDILKYLNGSAQDLVRMNPRWPWDVIFGHIADAAAGKFVIAAGILQKLRTSGVRHPDHIQQIINTVSAEFLGTIDPVDAPRKEEELRRPTDVSPLTILLEILRRKEPQTPMAEVATSGTVEFMTELLRRNEYASIPLQLNSNMQDALNLLEFIIYLIDSDLLLQEGNRKARRLMIKLGNMANNIPKSLFLNASDIKADRQSWPFAQGGFADVYEGEFRGNRVALKRVRQEAIDQVFVREALTWRTLSHDYVLPFLGIYQDSAGSGAICLVSPFMENGTLHDWRHDKNPGVPEIEIRILQVAQGIQYLHREGVIHCDLRGSNVLLDYDFRVRIADFGLTRDTNATATANRSMSYRFAAPELFSGSDDMEEDDRIKRTEKTDVYAFGCLYYEVHFDCLPFGKGEDFYVINQIMHGRRPHRQTNPPLREEAWKLIETCWDQDPGKRPSMDDVVDTMISWSI